MQRSLLFFLLAVLIFSGCANPKPLAGGVTDRIPPSIVEERSTPNEQTNFRGSEIILEFDEWIQLKDVNNQLVISPLMPVKPEIKQRGKTITIRLPAGLREETTYTLNFGDAIIDLNEGNVIENFVFVFSTGPHLDSIRLNGNVIDAVTLKAAPGIWVMLYRSAEDSVVYLRKPDYVGKTDGEGNWSISFLPEDTFSVFALKDENLNFLYDQGNEYFGWLDEPVHTGQQSGELPAIFIFPKAGKTIVKEVIHASPGWIKTVVEGPHPRPLPALVPELDNPLTQWHGDTMHIWYDPQLNYTGYVVLEDDSTRVRASTQPSPLNTPLSMRAVTGRISAGSKAVFTFNTPLLSIDQSLITLQHDSLGILPATIIKDSLDVRRFSIEAAWSGPSRYSMEAMPQAFTDVWGRTNDTIRHSIVVSGADQFADLFIHLDGLDASLQYVILLKEGDLIIDTFVVQGATETRLEKRRIAPVKYTIEVIEDRNRNGAWDTGAYERRIQPERKMIFQPEKLRAGWEQEVKFSWKINR